jgi:amino acid permease
MGGTRSRSYPYQPLSWVRTFFITFPSDKMADRRTLHLFTARASRRVVSIVWLIGPLFAHAVQGWSSVIPRFSLVDFLSFYVELLVMAIMYCLWLVFHRAFRPRTTAAALLVASPSLTTESESTTHPEAQPFFDFVDASDVDLYRDEHEETRVEKHEDEVREQRLRGRVGWAWTLYYTVA